MALVPAKYLDAELAIGKALPDGSRAWVATGFLYGVRTKTLEDGNGLYNVFLVTNRHVVERLGSPTAILRCDPEAAGPAKEYTFTVTDAAGKSSWTLHPDGDVDVAVASIDIQKMLREKMQVYFFQNDTDVANAAQLATLGTSEGDFAYVLGFPMGRVWCGAKRRDRPVRFNRASPGICRRSRTAVYGRCLRLSREQWRSRGVAA